MMKDSLNIGAIHKLLRICQRLIAICCCVLMFSDVAGVSNAGVSLVQKCAYIGQATKLLYTIDSDYADPSLYSENGTFIASWKGTTNTVAYMNPHYSRKFDMDQNRSIWILGVEREDAGNYSVKFGADRERPEVDIILTVKEELTDEQPQECPNNHPDFTKEDSCNQLNQGLQIVTCITEMIILLCILLANRIQIREGLINMKDWIEKKLCSQHISENGSRMQAIAIAMDEPEMSKEDLVHKWLNENSEFINQYIGKLVEKQIQKLQDAYPGLFKNKYHGNLTGEQIGQTRELLDEHTKHIKEYVGNLTGEQIGQIRELLDEHTKHIKEYVVETKPKFRKLSETVVGLPPRNDETFLNDTQSSTSNVEQNTNIKSKKTPEEKLESLDSDSNDEQDVFLTDHVDKNV